MVQTELSTNAAEIRTIVARHNHDRGKLMLIFHDMVEQFQHLQYDDIRELSRLMEIQPTDLFSVASFYSFFPLMDKGKYIVRLCQTISCDMQGKKVIADALKKELGIAFGETSKDKKWTLEYTNCMGFCDQGPAMLINDKVYTHLTPAKIKEIISQYA